MCGRMVLTRSTGEIAESFGLLSNTDLPDLEARYNIAPSQNVAAVRQESPAGRCLVELYWGLIPSWVKRRQDLNPMINARSETAASKPSFREALRRRRCLVPIDGFYEWYRPSAKKGASRAERGASVPHYFRNPEGHLLAIAGLWEQWTDRQTGEVIESGTLLTTEANEVVGPIHHRMPVILDSSNWDLWLDPDCRDSERVSSLLCPAPESLLEATRVTTHVNNVRNEDSRCIEPEP